MTPIQQMMLGLGGALQKFFGDKGFTINGKTGNATSVNDITNSVSIQTISTLANATNWGNLSYNSQLGCAFSDGDYVYNHIGLTWPGYGSYIPIMSYQKLAPTGGASSGGSVQLDGSAKFMNAKGASNGNRGAFMGGNDRGGGGWTGKHISYIDFATLGGSADFGDLIKSRSAMTPGNAGNKTRSLCFGGGDNYERMIEYITLDTTGNANDFGDWDIASSNGNNSNQNGRTEGAVASNETRALFMGGRSPWGAQKDIGYVTIDTTSNTSDFGDLRSGYYNAQVEIMAYSNGTKAVKSGGGDGIGSVQNGAFTRNDYVTIDTTSSASAGGDLNIGRQESSSASAG